MAMNLTPAALAALARGDLDNFATAATPGGIEAQEAAGQAMLCAAAQLPRHMRGCTREQLEAIGFKFGADVDDLFVTCALPPGWKKKATEHSMHSDLLDDKGRRRGSVFYKAAFYDRKADLRMSPRYSYTPYEGGKDRDHYRCVIMDCGSVLHEIGEYRSDDYGKGEALGKQADAWLTERFPNWRDAFAYWD